jgi:hypothetical protein
MPLPSQKSLLILGGTGLTGRLVARLLLQETAAHLVIAGRNLPKAQSLAVTLNQQFSGQRVSSCQTDAADPRSLQQAFSGMDWIIVASSTAEYAANVAGAALQAGAHYLDVQFSNQKYAALRLLQPEIERQERCFITDGGFHPGLPAALVRWAGLRFTRLESANVSSVIQIDWRALDVAQSTLDELVTELMGARMEYFHQSRWKQVNWTGAGGIRYFQFPPPFGRRYAMPMYLEEMRLLPETYPSLIETGFFVGGFNWFVDYLVFPLLMVMLKVALRRSLRPAGRLLRWGLNTFSRPPYGTLLKLEARGTLEGQAKALELTISHPDGYFLTAVPVVACLLQSLDGSALQPGLWTQAWVVEPERFLLDIERLGIGVSRKVVEP